MRTACARPHAPAKRLAAAAWLFNPYTAGISTRGSCDAIPTLAVLLALRALIARRTVIASAWYAFAVHLRLYPAIFAPALLLFLDGEHYRPSAARGGSDRGGTGTRTRARARAHAHAYARTGVRGAWVRALTRDRAIFCAVGGVTLAALCGGSYAACGGAYAHEALLHHVGRADPRHNFSPYWYAMHLAEHVDAAEAHALDADVAAAARDALGAPAEDDGQGDALRVGVPRARLFPAGAMRLLAFVPQLAVVVALPLALSADLPLCLFAQTAAFVALNKVRWARARTCATVRARAHSHSHARASPFTHTHMRTRW